MRKTLLATLFSVVAFASANNDPSDEECWDRWDSWDRHCPVTSTTTKTTTTTKTSTTSLPVTVIQTQTETKTKTKTETDYITTTTKTKTAQSTVTVGSCPSGSDLTKTVTATQVNTATAIQTDIQTVIITQVNTQTVTAQAQTQTVIQTVTETSVQTATQTTATNPACSAPTGQNLLINPSFESAATAPWFVVGDVDFFGSRVQVGDAIDGSFVWRDARTVTPETQASFHVLGQAVAVCPGRTYTLTGYMRLSPGSPANAVGTNLLINGQGQSAFLATANWTPFSWSWIAPADTAVYSFAFLIFFNPAASGVSGIEFDSFQLVPQ